jgi:hypothetical protein
VNTATLQVEYCNHLEDPIPDFPLKVQGAVGSVIDGKVTVCGGQDLLTRNYVSECYQLDHNQVVWKAFPSLSHARYESGEGLVKQGWWVIGGEGGNGAAANTTEIFKDGVWKAGPEIPPVFDTWTGKPCVVNINDTHTFVAGGDANGDQHLTFIYNWLDGTWVIQHSIPQSISPISKCVKTSFEGKPVILAGRDDDYIIFYLDLGVWSDVKYNSNCDFDNILVIDDVLMTMSPGERVCWFNTTQWIASPNSTLNIDYPRRDGYYYQPYHITASVFLKVQGRSCNSNVMILTGGTGLSYPSNVEVISVDASNEKCTLPSFPVNYFDVSLALLKNEILGCTISKCYILDKTTSQWKETKYLGLNGYPWTSIQSTHQGLWTVSGASNKYQDYDCERYPGYSNDCYGTTNSRIHCSGNDVTIYGPEPPMYSFGHCTINLNETHTMIAGGLQTNRSGVSCSATPFSGADACVAKWTWVFNWESEEWHQLPDLVQPAAFASCGNVQVTVNRSRHKVKYDTQCDKVVSSEGQ